jgi:hypothetical protein
VPGVRKLAAKLTLKIKKTPKQHIALVRVYSGRGILIIGIVRVKIRENNVAREARACYTYVFIFYKFETWHLKIRDENTFKIF